MRAIILVTMFLLAGTVGWAQTSPAPSASVVQVHPEGAMMANPPAARPIPGVEQGWPPVPPGQQFYWRHHHGHGPMILGLVLSTIITLAASFALVALGIFLLRRSAQPTVVRT